MGVVNKSSNLQAPKSLGTFGGPGKIKGTWLNLSAGDKVFWAAMAVVVVMLATMNW